MTSIHVVSEHIRKSRESIDNKLIRIAREAIDASENKSERRQNFQAMISRDSNSTQLIWRLFKDVSTEVLDSFLNSLVKKNTGGEIFDRILKKSRPDLISPPVAKITKPDRGAVARAISYMERFFINGKPIGKCNRIEVSEWGDNQTRNGKLAEVIIVPMISDKLLVSDCWTIDEFNKIYNESRK